MNSFSEHLLIRLKDANWFDRQKIAGQCVAKCLKTTKDLIKSGARLSLKDLEQAAVQVMKDMDCEPTFLNYQGSGGAPFPGAICTSVNKQLVHGIPTDYIIQDGDIVKIDLGATYKGAIADAAISVIYGSPKHKDHVLLLETCQKSLANAIAAVAIGKRLGVIGAAIHHTVKSTRFGLITNYGGHGIDENKPHAQPFVANKSNSNSGVRLQAGMTIAIEPMVVIGDTRTRVLSDGWTVATDDVGAHFEHTLFIGEDKVHVMTEEQ